MANKFNFVGKLLLVMTVALALSVSVSVSATKTRKDIGSTFLDNASSSTVNLYKLAYEYLSAVLSEGIPALGVQPVDPLSLDAVEYTFTDNDNTSHPLYPRVVVNTKGLTVYDFADFQIKNARLDPDEMVAELEIYKEHIGFQLNDGYFTFFDLAGYPHECHCRNITIQIFDNHFRSVKQLEVRGEKLHVKRFDLKYNTAAVLSTIHPLQCSCETKFILPVSEAVDDLATQSVFDEWPAQFEAIGATIATVLNDIFDLRNITDDSVVDTVKVKSTPPVPPTPSPWSRPVPKMPGNVGHRRQQMAVDAEDGQSIRKVTTRDEYSASASGNSDTEAYGKMQIKWSSLFN